MTNLLNKTVSVTMEYKKDESWRNEKDVLGILLERNEEQVSLLAVDGEVKNYNISKVDKLTINEISEIKFEVALEEEVKNAIESVEYANKRYLKTKEAQEKWENRYSLLGKLVKFLTNN